MQIRLTAALFIAATAGACALPNPVPAGIAQSRYSTPVTCVGACTVEWQRAQLWLNAHSMWKLQAATDVVLQTFSPNGDPSYGFTVVREPQPGGYRITLSMGCGNIFGCSVEPADINRAFYHYVATGEDFLIGIRYNGAIR